MDGHPLCNTHMKLLAFELLSLHPTQTLNNSSPLLSIRGVPVRRAETVGVVVSRDLKPEKFLKFELDDGTECVTCIVWLNHHTSQHFSRHLGPADRHLAADAALRYADAARVGSVVRVRGRVGKFRDRTQITVSDVVVETDPNVQTLHWLDCLTLARRRYDAFAVK